MKKIYVVNLGLSIMSNFEIKKIENIQKFKDINNLINNIDSFERYSINENKINQLFSKEPPSFDLVKEIIYSLFNKELNDSIYYEFTVKSLVNKKSVSKIEEYIIELKKYYLKCKHNKYLENLNEKKLITMLRQILKLYDFSVNSIEKYNNGEKFLLYTIEKKKDLYIKKINSFINFD